MPPIPPTARANAVVDRLTTLQNNHRLVIHMLERDDTYVTRDSETLRCLNENEHHDISLKLRNYSNDIETTHIPLFSTSLIPSADSGRSMVPFLACPDYLNNYGYLMNATQRDEKTSPRVLRIDSDAINSGMEFSNKNLRFDTVRDDHTDTFYRSIHSPVEEDITKLSADAMQERVIRAMGGRNGADYADAQLSMLSAMPPNLYGGKDGEKTYGPGIERWNELVGAFGKQHVEAISVPLFESLAKPHPSYRASCKLQAALIGLEHMEHGYHWPVLFYHVSPPQQGALTFVGQTRHELIQAGLEALHELGTTKLDINKPESFCLRKRAAPQLSVLHEATQRLLGIDLRQTASGPHGWRQQVDSQLASLAATNPPAAPALAPQSHRTLPESGGRY